MYSLLIVYTLHHHYIDGKYGFESSQLTRMELARLSGFDYKHLITSPKTNAWENRFKEYGFIYGDYILLPKWFLGNVLSQVINSNEEIQFEQGYAFVCDDRWCFSKDGQIYSEEDLIILYLLSVDIDSSDVFIRDDSRIPMHKLVRFMKFKGLRYYEYVHHRVLDNGLLPVLNKKISYLVANEFLASQLKELGYKAKFFPPLLLKEVNLKSKNSIQRYLWSGHFGDYKNFNQTLRVFSRCPTVSLDIYGGTFSEFERYALDVLGYIPENICYRGFVDNVPYSTYDGYISTSNGEVFANSCVEAMSLGLKCIVKNTNYPYKQYQDGTQGDVSTASTDDEFVELLNYWSQRKFIGLNQKDYVEGFLFKTWVEPFQNLMKDGK